MIAQTPQPPYFAVIFSSLRSDGDHGYAAMSEKMMELAQQQPGFLGVETAREQVGITVSYWRDLESIKNWKQNIAHRKAQQLGRDKWYTDYKLRIAKVEHDYGHPKGGSS